jgi:hypothetical protein
MPIVIKDYTWSETESEVHVVVPLKGVKAAKADVYSTATYIKVSILHSGGCMHARERERVCVEEAEEERERGGGNTF